MVIDRKYITATKKIEKVGEWTKCVVLVCVGDGDIR